MISKEQLCSLFIVGIKDFKYSAELKSFLKEFPVSGISLFNSPHDSSDFIWKDPDAALERIYEFVENMRKHVSFIAVDQEGGRVKRLRSPFVELPKAQLMGEWFKSEKRADQVFEIYRLAARQLSLSGIRLNFAPVCDLRQNSTHEIIADRSFGSRPEDVVPLVRLFCEAMQSEEVFCTLKHFPGHGPSRLDSHQQVALIEKDPPDYEREDKKIFLDCAGDAFGIMTAHIAHAERPERILSLDSEFIRHSKAQMPKHLVWMTDDLITMKAVSERRPWISCLEAEYDYLNLCGSLDQSASAIEDCIKHIEASPMDFGERLALETRCRHSSEYFQKIEKLTKFKVWKSEITGLNEKAEQILEKENLI